MESVLETVCRGDGEVKNQDCLHVGTGFEVCFGLSQLLSWYSCHQEILDILSNTMNNTGIPCAVMLDTKGPEIRAG